jgi:hypothetical protein
MYCHTHRQMQYLRCLTLVVNMSQCGLDKQSLTWEQFHSDSEFESSAGSFQKCTKHVFTHALR